MGRIGIKRIYEPPAAVDGQRILVDRIWPRGVSKDAAHLTDWLKDIAPSSALRKWFDHDPAKFREFASRYRSELDANAEAVEKLLSYAAAGDMTLLYAAHDEKNNQAVVLRDYIKRRQR